MSDTEKQDSNILPLIALRDIVIYPYISAQLFVGREKSIFSLDQATEYDNKILLVAQRDPDIDDPEAEDLFEYGTVVQVNQLLRLPDGTVKILVEGMKQVKINELIDKDKFTLAKFEDIDLSDGNEDEIDALVKELRVAFAEYIRSGKKISQEVIQSIEEVSSYDEISFMVASHLEQDVEVKQEILETAVLSDRIEKLIGLIRGNIEVIQLEKRIRSRVKKQMEKTQREYYLNEQMKAIQKELNDGEELDEIAEYEKRIADTKLSEEALEKCNSELRKLKSMSPMSAEATVVRSYLDWMLDVPWHVNSETNLDIEKAEEILDADHYGLEKVKERIIEYLAVQQRSDKIRGPILCLIGPPGVGKTSLGSSIARAAGREFVRMSLGGVRDESEIRGHRRTYIGSMPGKILQSLKKVKVSNPLFLLDEVDKMGQDFRGDPAAALLEVLDPEQNNTFMDHYLEVEYDLSDIMFIATANSYNLPEPLLDRMEIIQLSGYTETEKLEIAKRHLVKKQIDMNGLKEEEWNITDDALLDLIRYYTRESGVRSLEREIAKLTRKSLKEILTNDISSVSITSENLSNYAGVRKYRFGVMEEKDQVGITTGLAWTSVGGEILSIEAVTLKGKGSMKVTGKLGEVMQESIQIAHSYVQSKSTPYGIMNENFEKKDIHVHVPEGATPKDGPSAGVAMVTSIVSVLTDIPVRRDVAMTGEVTLRGNVLPIGGLKEKLLAAVRGGIKTVIVPKENEKDISEIPDNITSALEIVYASHVDDVLSVALTKELEPLPPKVQEDSSESLAKDTLQ